MLKMFRAVFFWEVSVLFGFYVPILVWPQCWSFADVSQLWVDFTKKINKIKMIFLFDFHRCSHGLSKIGHHFRKQSGSKIEVFNLFSKNDYKKTFSKLIFFNEKKNQKDLYNCENWTFKVNFLYQKSSESFWFFFSLKNNRLGAHFLLR